MIMSSLIDDWQMVPASGQPPRVIGDATSFKCEAQGHDWYVLPYPRAAVFDPRTGSHLHNTYEVACRNCPLIAHVDHRPPELACSSAVEPRPVKAAVEGSNPSAPATCGLDCELCEEW